MKRVTTFHRPAQSFHRRSWQEWHSRCQASRTWTTVATLRLLAQAASWTTRELATYLGCSDRGAEAVLWTFGVAVVEAEQRWERGIDDASRVLAVNCHFRRVTLSGVCLPDPPDTSRPGTGATRLGRAPREQADAQTRTTAPSLPGQSTRCDAAARVMRQRGGPAQPARMQAGSFVQFRTRALRRLAKPGRAQP